MAEKVTVNSQMAFSSGAVPSEEVVTDDFVAQMRLVPVKVEPPDEEPIEPQIFHPRLEKEEIITDDVPTQMNLAPIPLKLVEAATGKQIQCQPGVSNADDCGEADASSNQEPLVLIKQEPEENVSDDDCSHEMPYCPTELVQTSFGTYDMPESFKSETEEFEGGHQSQRSSRGQVSSTKRSRKWRASLSQDQREELRRVNRERERRRRKKETEEEHQARLEAARVRYHAKRVKREIEENADQKSALTVMENSSHGGGEGEQPQPPEDGEKETGEALETRKVKVELDEETPEYFNSEEKTHEYASDPEVEMDFKDCIVPGTSSPVCCQNAAKDGSTSDETYNSLDTETDEESESGGETKSLDGATPAKVEDKRRRKRRLSFGWDSSEETRIRKERDRKRKREKRRNETPVQREERLKRIREYIKNKRRSETMEETEMRLSRMRKWAAERRISKNPWKHRTTGQGQEGSDVDAEGGSSSCTTGTAPVGWEAELDEGSGSNSSITSVEKVEGSRRSATVETEEERLLRLKNQRERKARRLANETAEQREDRLENVRERKKEKIEEETAEQRGARLKQLSAYVGKSKLKKTRRLSRIEESPEERRKRLESLKTSQKKRLAKETAEQRRNRLEKMKTYQAKRIENETPEERENRLTRARIYSAQRDERLRQMKRGNTTSE